MVRECWIAVCIGLALSGGCAQTPSAPAPEPSYFRQARARRMETIFTQIDLPAPSRQRLVTGAPGPEYWQQGVRYDIDATLDAESKVLRGRETIAYTNNSPDALDHVWLHLEQNLFRKESLGALKTPPGARFGNRDGFEGGFEIDYVKVSPTVSLSDTTGVAASLEPGADLDLHVYDTIGRIDLPVPIAPNGGKLVFEIAWSFKIPEYGSDRMGWQTVADGTVFEMAQWFPAMAVYDDVYGWNTLPYLGQGEFYTNVSDFNVRLTVPRSHLVAATGELQNPDDVLTSMELERLAQARLSAETVMIRGEPEVKDSATRPEGDGPLTWWFDARSVRTFAFASSDAFIWDASFLEDSGPEGPDGVPVGTLVQSVYPKEATAWKRSTEMLRFAIDGYNKRWFRYPYPVATNVNGIVGGMEYPMIIFCGSREDENGLWGVTTHEIGHNWFPMTVNTDERRHAWMDEGFNTFINYYSNREWKPETAGGRGDARGFVNDMLLPDQQPMEMPADQVDRLGMMEYAKTATALVLLREQVLGPERFDAAFREYIRRWAFKSPRPADFFRCMEDVAGQGLDWFWRGWFLETGTLDQAVVSVEQEAGGAKATFVNLGELVMPLTFKVTYSDGSSEMRYLPVETWFHTNKWTTGWDTGGKTVTGIVVDPDEEMPDCDATNNAWSAPAAK